MNTQPIQWSDVQNTVESRRDYLRSHNMHILQSSAPAKWRATVFADDLAAPDRQRLIQRCAPWRDNVRTFTRWAKPYAIACGAVAMLALLTIVGE